MKRYKEEKKTREKKKQLALRSLPLAT